MINLLDPSIKTRYWTVGDKIFYDKFLAMRYATEKNLECNDLKYYFHDEYFDSFDWKKPTDTNLEQLYVKRAWELRNKYDYLILHYSGGWDSQNILEIFARNNIPLEEIIIRGSNLENVDPTTPTPENLDAEVIVRAMPLAKFIKEHQMPHLKITFADTTKTVIEWWNKNKDVFDQGQFITDPTHVVRYDFHKMICENEKFYENKKVGHILGHDKPRIGKDEIGYFTIFRDEGTFKHVKPRTMWDRHDFEVEFFYWDRSTAEMVINQCHIVLDAVLAGKADFDFFTVGFTAAREDFIGNLIYKRQYDIPFYQPKSNPDTMMYSNSWWFGKDKGTQYFKNYAKHLWEWKKILHPSFFNQDGGIRTLASKRRYLRYFTDDTSDQ